MNLRDMLEKQDEIDVIHIKQKGDINKVATKLNEMLLDDNIFIQINENNHFKSNVLKLVSFLLFIDNLKALKNTKNQRIIKFLDDKVIEKLNKIDDSYETLFISR